MKRNTLFLKPAEKTNFHRTRIDTATLKVQNGESSFVCGQERNFNSVQLYNAPTVKLPAFLLGHRTKLFVWASINEKMSRLN